MPLTARQLRQPLTIEAIGRVPYFADAISLVNMLIALVVILYYIYLIIYIYRKSEHR